jgi:hypothetical protein
VVGVLLCCWCLVCSCFFGGEESYLLLEGESRRRSRLRTWADGRPRRLLCRPWCFWYGVVVVGVEDASLRLESEVPLSLGDDGGALWAAWWGALSLSE